VRDDQVRRYARHLALPEIGGLGQSALLVASARLALRDSEPIETPHASAVLRGPAQAERWVAELICGSYLAAGGVGTLVAVHATNVERTELAARGVDTRVVDFGEGREVTLEPRPAWWPAADGDAAALAFFRGAIAATRWMAEAIDGTAPPFDGADIDG
jgi:hypothetical protein